MDKLTVIKVGGKIVEEKDTLQRLLDDFAGIDGYKVLTHGGGRSATRLATRLGIESRMVNGRRITDAETLQVVTMVYGGLVNKNIVAGLQARGVNALGLTGADMDVIRSVKRPVQEVDYGFVGDVRQVNVDLLADLIYKGGFSLMRYSISDTAEFGDYETGKRIITDETKKEMKKILEEIQDGTFASKWIAENNNGRAHFNAKRAMEASHQLEEVGKELRKMYSWSGEKEDM